LNHTRILVGTLAGIFSVMNLLDFSAAIINGADGLECAPRTCFKLAMCETAIEEGGSKLLARQLVISEENAIISNISSDYSTRFFN
jgi:hypothetical protein